VAKRYQESLSRCITCQDVCVQQSHSDVASPKIGGGGKMFDFSRIILFCLEKHLPLKEQNDYIF